MFVNSNLVFCFSFYVRTSGPGGYLYGFSTPFQATLAYFLYITALFFIFIFCSRNTKNMLLVIFYIVICKFYVHTTAYFCAG